MIVAPPLYDGAAHVSATDESNDVPAIDVGAAGTPGGAGANDAEYTNKFGLAVPGFVTMPRVAAFNNVLVTSAGVAVGLDDKYSAATPATCGDAIDVPDNDATRVVLPMNAEVMLWPGAKMSTQVPQLENDARESTDVDAATVIASGALAGDRKQAFVFSLPAATTYVMPSATARATAAFTALLAPPPRLMLATAGTPAW